MKWFCQERCSQCVVCALTMSFASCTSCQCYVKYFTRFTYILLDVEVFEAQKLGVGHLVNFSTKWACGGKYYYSRQFFTSRTIVIFPTNAQCERNEVRVRRKKQNNKKLQIVNVIWLSRENNKCLTRYKEIFSCILKTVPLIVNFN